MTSGETPNTPVSPEVSQRPRQPFLRRLTVNGLLVLASAAFAGICGEVILRLFGQSVGVETWQENELTVHDSLVGWRLMPNASGQRVTSEYSITETVNALGYRGPAVSLEKPDTTYRILVLGDSYAEGYTVEEAEVFSEVLRNLLIVEGRSVVEVVNFGTRGYGTDQEYLRFDRDGRQYDPDLTVVLFYENDVWNNGQADYYGYPKPRFVLADGEAVLETPAGPYIEEEMGPDTTKSFVRSVDDTFMAWSQLYRFVRLNVKKIPIVYNTARALGFAQGGVAVPADFFAWAKSPPPDVEQSWELTGALLRRIRDEAKVQQSDFTLFYVPSPALIDLQQWEATKNLYGLDDGGWSPDEPRRRILEMCAAFDFFCIDPTEDFLGANQQLAAVDGNTYLKGDRHWTVEGHRVAGQVLAEHIQRRMNDTTAPVSH